MKTSSEMASDIESWASAEAENKLSGTLPKRWLHSVGVARRAKSAASIFSARDGDILVAAAFLHDIGYASDLASSGFHPLDGARYLVDKGAPYRLCALVAHHSCAYREARLRGVESSLYSWEDEKTFVRDALWWADMTTTPGGKITSIHDRVEEIQKRYGKGDLVSVFIRQAKPELVAAVERTEKRLKEAGLDHLVK